MSNWKLGIRMAVGFGIVILVAVFLGVFSYSRVSAIDTKARDVVENEVPSLILMGEVEANAQKLYGIQLLHVLSSDAHEMAGYEAELTALRSRNAELLDHYQKDLVSNETEAALIKRLLEARLAFKTGSDEMLAVSRKGTPESNAQALKMIYALRPVNDKYIDLISEDIKFNKDLGDTEIKAMKDSVASAHVGILICIVLAVLLAAVIALYITRGITQPIGMAVATLERVAEGDLTASLNVESKDEIGQMANALNLTIERLNSTLREVADSAANASSSSQQLAAASESIAGGAQEQAASLEETSASLEQITSAVRQSADNAQQASQLATSSKEAAEKGQQVVASAITAMTEINVASAKISDIISTIDEIAFQTNLLAVNAAVEAARAGDEGRGFAVVASEVRSLAQRSAVAAKEIKVLIQDSLRKVEAGSTLVNRSGETLLGIVGSVKRVTDIVGEIAAASGEQSSGIEQVNQAITQMDQVTQSNSAQTEELSGTAQALSEQATNLMDLIATFTLTQEGKGQREKNVYARMAPPPDVLASRPSVQAQRAELRRPAAQTARTIAAPKAENRPKRVKAQAKPALALAATGAPAAESSAAAKNEHSFEEF
jgi:methyl-accepting chemotaxis protein